MNAELATASAQADTDIDAARSTLALVDALKSELFATTQAFHATEVMGVSVFDWVRFADPFDTNIELAYERLLTSHALPSLIGEAKQNISQARSIKEELEAKLAAANPPAPPAADGDVALLDRLLAADGEVARLQRLLARMNAELATASAQAHRVRRHTAG